MDTALEITFFSIARNVADNFFDQQDTFFDKLLNALLNDMQETKISVSQKTCQFPDIKNSHSCRGIGGDTSFASGHRFRKR